MILTSSCNGLVKNIYTKKSAEKYLSNRRKNFKRPGERCHSACWWWSEVPSSDLIWGVCARNQSLPRQPPPSLLLGTGLCPQLMSPVRCEDIDSGWALHCGHGAQHWPWSPRWWGHRTMPWLWTWGGGWWGWFKFLINSTPCKNHFCSFKTLEVTNIFYPKIFSLLT